MVAGVLALLGMVGCGSTDRSSQAQAPRAKLLAEARPIGRGPAFQPPVSGTVSGPCRVGLGPRAGVHVEVFAANRVVLIAAGVGTKPPRRVLSGRVSSAGCYGDLVTLDPTGLVLVRAGAQLTLADLFRSWGQPLTSRRVASFSAATGEKVRVFVDGRRWRGPPRSVPLSVHSEIVVEVGPYVPPHSAYTFPPGL
jgi:hypothetical protein